jgi:DNA topoisomerase VI subunit B
MKSPKKPHKLTRSTLSTPRLLDFFSERELTTQIGHPKRDWPLVIGKELIDNSLDACEDASVPPEITMKVDKNSITVIDNGPGLPAATVGGVVDFSVRASSREHYVSPTRGAQGFGLKSAVAMPFVLDTNLGRVDITACGVLHEIHVSVDPFEGKPKIRHLQHKVLKKNGTIVRLYWPDSASSILAEAKNALLRIADDFTFLNPHLTLHVDLFGERRSVQATNPTWKKWQPSDLPSVHWYPLDRFQRAIVGYLRDDECKGRVRTLREFVADFAGLAGSGKQKAVLESVDLLRTNLSALRNGDGLDEAKVAALLQAMKDVTRPIRPAAMGVIGREHIAKCFQALNCDMETFVYHKTLGSHDGVPWVRETAFAATEAGLDLAEDAEPRRLITGVNWSPAIINPFRLLGDASLDSVLQEQRAGSSEPVLILLHLACPRVSYVDRGKSAIVVAQANGVL